MSSKRILSFLILLTISSCTATATPTRTTSATPFILTTTIPLTPSSPPTETPLPPPTPTITPVEGVSSTQLNVRSEPSTASAVLGIIPPNTKVEIIGKDPGGSWWQILYPAGTQGKGWVTSQYVTSGSPPEVPVIGGGANPNDGNVAVVQQQLNVRSGPGADFNSVGTLNPQDVARLIGKDANGLWLQIEFVAGPDGKGWISAAFVQAKGVEGLPILTESGTVVGTGTPMDTPQPP
ncbi:MAG TPA: SH3 domain-containing protein, partial [Anaerolineales bacterium]|nr:SH3 domain-containing protein [Anaerolineales bacterium]